jgi:hypothetical protein
METSFSSKCLFSLSIILNSWPLFLKGPTQQKYDSRFVTWYTTVSHIFTDVSNKPVPSSRQTPLPRLRSQHVPPKAVQVTTRLYGAMISGFHRDPVHRPEDEADEGPRNVISNSTVRRWKTQRPSALYGATSRKRGQRNNLNPKSRNTEHPGYKIQENCVGNQGSDLQTLENSDDIFAVLGCYAVQTCSHLSTFRYKLLVQSSRVASPRLHMSSRNIAN